MQKLNEEEYLRKALKLWGINKDCIENRIKDRIGIAPVEELYKCYESEVSSELVFNNEGKVDLEKMKFERSMIDVNNSSKAYGWIIFPDLSVGMLKSSFENIKNNKEDGKRARYATLVSASVAKELGIESATYYLTTNKINDKLKNELGYIYTPNFLKYGEELISGLDISTDSDVMTGLRGNVNGNDMKRMEKALTIYLNNRRFSQEEIEDTRRNLIKQCIISKILGNKDEANRNWGIIISKQRNVRLAPMYDLESCLQDKYINSLREINGSTELSNFISHYSKEEWFNEWINDKVFNLDIESVYRGMLETSKITIPDNYRKEFKNKIEQSINTIRNVYNKKIEQSER